MKNAVNTPTRLSEEDLDAVAGAGTCDVAHYKTGDFKGQERTSESASGDGHVSSIDALLVINR